METILKKLKCYWLPVLWALCVITASFAAIKNGGVIEIVAALFNLIAGIWAVFNRAKAWKDFLYQKEDTHDI